MSEEAAWEMITQAEQGVFVSLRRSGEPVALPVWFVVDDQQIYLRTPARSKKVARIRADDRISFLVQDGRAWSQLRGVHLSGHARIADDPQLEATVDQLMERKYAGLRTPASDRPAATNEHYRERVLIQIVPTQILSWDNGLLRLGAAR